MKHFTALLLLLVLCTVAPVTLFAQADSLGSEQTVPAESTETSVSKSSDPKTGQEPESAPSEVSTEQSRGSDLDIRSLISFRKIILSFSVLGFTYLLNMLLVRLLDTVSERWASYRLFIKRLVPITRIIIWIISLYIVIEGIIDPPLETIVTVTASVGIAVGFASQDILKNIFGGIMIILDRPFQVGDKVQIGDHYGEVLQIGLRSSRLVTPDDSVVSVPNAEIMNKAVSNANSSALDCQVVAEIFLPATVDIDLVKQIARKAAFTSRYTYLAKQVAVIAKNEIHEKQFVVKLRVKAYVLDIRYEFPFQSELTEIILAECTKENLYQAKS